MKITNEDKKLFKETYSKYKLKEGILSRLFLRALTKNIKNDSNIQKAIKDADDSLQNAQKTIEKRFDGDKEKVKQAIPDNVRKYLGFDY
ncbi:MAG: hypothetical protein RLY15_1299 [Bacteroidota bacterium]|jgi:uncharacterized membrane-anchored protein YhcB (DUF1043 family)